MKQVSHSIDRVDATFDERTLVANAGLILVRTLALRLDLERLVDCMVRLVGRVGGARPGRKVLTLVLAMVAGASHIDHADVLRTGATERVLAHEVMAPSTLGTFLRAFTSATSANWRPWSVKSWAGRGPWAPARDRRVW